MTSALPGVSRPRAAAAVPHREQNTCPPATPVRSRRGSDLGGLVQRVTRSEILDHIESAFGDGAALRADILSAAEESGARSEVMAVLRRLPDRRLALRQLWVELPGIPVRV
ncbi:MAG: DUF2795 domain-containing protein [Streptosporangiales bacterium]|nr:DUF2795 domain-containing protein [Streptosporangiales bacterium]